MGQDQGMELQQQLGHGTGSGSGSGAGTRSARGGLQGDLEMEGMGDHRDSSEGCSLHPSLTPLRGVREGEPT
jgi:hypothetical protein